MKRLIVLLTAFLWLNPVHAQWSFKEPKTIYLQLKSGQTASIAFKAYPPTYFVLENEKIVFYADNKSYEYEIKDVVKMYTDVSIPTAIDNNMMASSRVFHVSEESVSLSGFDTNEPVRVYSVAGHEYLTLHTSDRGELKISCSRLAKGVSIIKTKDQSIKVIIK
jgi:hypothetical protein